MAQSAAGGCKKKKKSPDEKARQRGRTELNKLRRQKSRARRAAARKAKTLADPMRKGKSFAWNEALRKDAKANPLLRMPVVDGQVTPVRIASVGHIKKLAGIPTKWKENTR